MRATEVVAALKEQSTPQRAEASAWFFKTDPGQYGEGDKFMGVRVPDVRKVSRNYRELPLQEVQRLLDSPWHEQRQCGLFILVLQFQKAKKDEGLRQQLCDFYLDNVRTGTVNNWDLVDGSASQILGECLADKDRDVLYELAGSGELWQERVSIVATAAFIKRQDFTDTLKLSKLFLSHGHDLMHKATGWMLREVGKQDVAVLREFLDAHAHEMPRTMLRYSLEKLGPAERQKYMQAKEQ